MLLLHGGAEGFEIPRKRFDFKNTLKRQFACYLLSFSNYQTHRLRTNSGLKTRIMEKETFFEELILVEAIN